MYINSVHVQNIPTIKHYFKHYCASSFVYKFKLDNNEFKVTASKVSEHSIGMILNRTPKRIICLNA